MTPGFIAEGIALQPGSRSAVRRRQFDLIHGMQKNLTGKIAESSTPAR
jgi:hypothetical protein